MRSRLFAGSRETDRAMNSAVGSPAPAVSPTAARIASPDSNLAVPASAGTPQTLLSTRAVPAAAC